MDVLRPRALLVSPNSTHSTGPCFRLSTAPDLRCSRLPRKVLQGCRNWAPSPSNSWNCLVPPNCGLGSPCPPFKNPFPFTAPGAQTTQTMLGANGHRQQPLSPFLRSADLAHKSIVSVAVCHELCVWARDTTLTGCLKLRRCLSFAFCESQTSFSNRLILLKNNRLKDRGVVANSRLIASHIRSIANCCKSGPCRHHRKRGQSPNTFLDTCVLLLHPVQALGASASH